MFYSESLIFTPKNMEILASFPWAHVKSLRIDQEYSRHVDVEHKLADEGVKSLLGNKWSNL